MTPRYPDLEIRSAREGMLELPSDPHFNCFTHDAVGFVVRTELEPTSPGRSPRTVEVRFAVGTSEWDGMSEHDQQEFVLGQVDLAVRYRTATMS